MPNLTIYPPIEQVLAISNDGTKTTILGPAGDYIRIGDAFATSHSLNSEDDLMVTGELEVDGQAFFDSVVNFLGGFRSSGGALTIQTGTSQDVSLWGAGVGAGRTFLLTTASATDGQTNNSPTITQRARFDADPTGGVTSTDRDYDVLHSMITAGANPKSQVIHSIDSLAIMTMENDDTTLKTTFVGTVDAGAYAVNANAGIDDSGSGTITTFSITIEKGIVTAFSKLS